MSRVALIAGAGGAGSAVAVEFANRDFHVVVVDSRSAAADAAVGPLIAEGGSAESHGLDLLDLDSVTALRNDLVARLGGVDVVVHLVGGFRSSPTLGLDSVANWRALEPPVVGTLVTLTAVFGETVQSSEDGRVFMVTSTAAAHPTASSIAYAAAKSAAEAWMVGVADSFADTPASAVTVAVKALLTDQMIAGDPEKQWPGFTHVRVLATAIADASTGPVENGLRLDLTGPGYSTS